MPLVSRNWGQDVILILYEAKGRWELGHRWAWGWLGPGCPTGPWNGSSKKQRVFLFLFLFSLMFSASSFLPFLQALPPNFGAVPVFVIRLFSLASLPTQGPVAGILLLSALGRRGVRLGPHSLARWPYGNGILVSQFQFLLCALLPIWPEAWPLEPAGLG